MTSLIKRLEEAPRRFPIRFDDWGVVEATGIRYRYFFVFSISFVREDDGPWRLAQVGKIWSAHDGFYWVLQNPIRRKKYHEFAFHKRAAISALRARGIE